MGAKGEQTRRRLLQAAETLLNTTPLRDLTVAQIVRVAKTSTPTFYVYFNDVSEAVLALIGDLTQSSPNLLSIVNQPWEGEHAIDRAHVFVAAYVERWQSHAPAFRLRNLASDEGDARFTELRINAISPLLSAMARRIQARQRAGALTPDLHAPSAAGALLGMIERIAAMRPPPAQAGVTRPRLVHAAAFFAVLLLGDGRWTRGAVGAPGPALESEASRGGAAELKPQTETLAKPAPAVRGRNQYGQAMYEKGERTRHRLTEATGQLLHSASVLDLSVARITRLAGVSTATFYRYFEDIPEAVLAAVRETTMNRPDLIELLKQASAPRTASEGAYGFVARYIEYWQNNRALFRARNLAADEGDERFIDARVDCVRTLFDRMVEGISKCQFMGRLPRDLHPPSAAGACLAMIDRMAVTPNINTGNGVTLETVTHAAAFFLSVLMSGLPGREG